MPQADYNSALLKYRTAKKKALQRTGKDLHDLTFGIYREICKQYPDYETCPVPIGIDRFRWPSESCFLGTVSGGRHPSPTIEKLILKVIKAWEVKVEEEYEKYTSGD